jgi:hypothetical protein
VSLGVDGLALKRMCWPSRRLAGACDCVMHVPAQLLICAICTECSSDMKPSIRPGLLCCMAAALCIHKAAALHINASLHRLALTWSE